MDKLVVVGYCFVFVFNLGLDHGRKVLASRGS